MEAELRNIGCWDYVLGNDNGVTPDKKEKSYVIIMRLLEAPIVEFVGNKINDDQRGNGKALWDILKEKSVGNGLQAQGLALDQFLELKLGMLTNGFKILELLAERWKSMVHPSIINL